MCNVRNTSWLTAVVRLLWVAHYPHTRTVDQVCSSRSLLARTTYYHFRAQITSSHTSLSSARKIRLCPERLARRSKRVHGKRTNWFSPPNNHRRLARVVIYCTGTTLFDDDYGQDVRLSVQTVIDRRLRGRENVCAVPFQRRRFQHYIHIDDRNRFQNTYDRNGWQENQIANLVCWFVWHVTRGTLLLFVLGILLARNVSEL